MAIKRRIASQKEEEEKKAKRITPKKVLKKIKSKLYIKLTFFIHKISTK